MNGVASEFDNMMLHEFERLNIWSRINKKIRKIAIKADDHGVCEIDKQQHISAYKVYRSHRQLKKKNINAIA